ncbi:hypothetical protein NQ176_g3780 [Zarea fungicola]|uniref:Uncharacterized protein n=1 Tax=Zarea fungicola TaxID=93591 RepID=A0ACC1NHJ2_9HYPO|nr:hypothetical protein NQ176_g3780 [Lecanicillium fungicola]
MLTRLVAKFAPTLVDLALWDMTMAATDQQELDVWRRFWRGLAALPGLELRHIKVGRQKFEDGQHKLPAVRFAGGRNEAEYEGPDWRGFVKDSLENPEIERFVPQILIGVNLDGDNQDDADEEDEEDEDEDEDEDDDEDDVE